jgi:hypothetical protein
MGMSLETRGLIHTGTFFWDKTTAQFLPRTPTDVMLAAVIALKAYSEHRCKHYVLDVRPGWLRSGLRTGSRQLQVDEECQSNKSKISWDVPT